MKIIELQPEESALCKQLRLRSLKDNPGVFAQSLVEAEQKPDKYWQDITNSLTPPSPQRMFIACTHGIYYGSVFALLDKQDSRTGRIGGMWVDSSFRRRGIGKLLIKEVFSWAQKQQFNYLKLWVIDKPNSAKLFYENSGFQATENRDSNYSVFNQDLIEMVYQF